MKKVNVWSFLGRCLTSNLKLSTMIKRNPHILYNHNFSSWYSPCLSELTEALDIFFNHKSITHLKFKCHNKTLKRRLSVLCFTFLWAPVCLIYFFFDTRLQLFNIIFLHLWYIINQLANHWVASPPQQQSTQLVNRRLTVEATLLLIQLKHSSSPPSYECRCTLLVQCLREKNNRLAACRQVHQLTNQQLSSFPVCMLAAIGEHVVEFLLCVSESVR